MGTRSMTAVISKQKTKVAQYGQWDGYADGVGFDILKFLRNTDLNEFENKVDKLGKLTEEDAEIIDNQINSGEKKYKEDFPEYHRDTAAGVLDLIMQDKVWNNKMQIDMDGYNWAAWTYTIDLDDRELIVEHGDKYIFDLDNLPSNDEFLMILQPD